MSFGVGDSRETLAYFFCLFASLFLSTCLRSKPLLACGQRALRAYVAIVEPLFVQARYLLANPAKLLCSFLCPSALGAFVLLLRSLERIVGIYFLFYCNEFRGRRQSRDSRLFLWFSMTTNGMRSLLLAEWHLITKK